MQYNTRDIPGLQGLSWVTLHLLQADGIQQGPTGAALLGSLGIDEGKGHLQQQQQQQPVSAPTSAAIKDTMAAGV